MDSNCDPPVPRPNQQCKHVPERRVVGGELVSAVNTDTRWARIEVLRRRTQGSVDWEFWLSPFSCCNSDMGSRKA
jgi:hypothetical protein